MPKSKNKDPLRATTMIRPRSLRRAQIVSPFLGETMTEYVSKSADDRSRSEIKKRGITLPPDAEFESSVTGT